MKIFTFDNETASVNQNATAVAAAETEIGAAGGGGVEDEFAAGGGATMVKTRATLYLATVYVFICVLGLTANAAVLCMISRSRRSKAVTNIYIFNLALADLLYAVCLPAAVYQMLNGQWTFGHMMCKLYYTCDGVSKFASVMFLVVLSFDRYVAVCHPIKCRAIRTAKIAFATTGAAWTIVILAMVPIFLHATLLHVTDSNSDTFQCVIYWPPTTTASLNETTNLENNTNISSFGNNTNNNLSGNVQDVQETSDDQNGSNNDVNSNRRIFTLYLFTLSFLAPLAMVWIFYTMILHRLRAQKRRMFNSNKMNSNNDSSMAAAPTDSEPVKDDDDDHRTSSQRLKRPMLPVHIPSPQAAVANQRRSRSTKRVTIMVLSIVICYTVCWIPYWCVQTTIEFFPDLVQTVFDVEVFTIVSYIAYGMQSVNSMLNPFLYAFGTHTHRRRLFNRYRHFLTLVGCRWRCLGWGAPPPPPPPPPRQGSLGGLGASNRSAGGGDSCVLRRQPTASNQDLLLPNYGAPTPRIRKPRSASESYCESEISNAYFPTTLADTTTTRTADSDFSREPILGYCLCCYCEKKDLDPVVVASEKRTTKINSTKKNIDPSLGSTTPRLVQLRAKDDDHLDDDEDE